MPTENSNPKRWQFKKQTEIKHAILSNYLTGWISVLGRPTPDRPRTLYYVDGFAGRGKYDTGERGSPIIAMEVGQQLHDARGGDVSLCCYNIEPDDDNFASLKREVDAARDRFRSVSVVNYQGTIQEYEDRVLK